MFVLAKTNYENLAVPDIYIKTAVFIKVFLELFSNRKITPLLQEIDKIEMIYSWILIVLETTF